MPVIWFLSIGLRPRTEIITPQNGPDTNQDDMDQHNHEHDQNQDDNQDNKLDGHHFDQIEVIIK